MLLTDRDAVTAALTDPTLDSNLRALIGLRVWTPRRWSRRTTCGNNQKIVIHSPTARQIGEAATGPAQRHADH